MKRLVGASRASRAVSSGTKSLLVRLLLPVCAAFLVWALPFIVPGQIGVLAGLTNAFADAGDSLCCNQYISNFEKLTSQNGIYSLVMQGNDGHLVLYNNVDGIGACWQAPGTSGHPNDVLTMQTDGNLVVYTSPPFRSVLWASNTGNHPQQNYFVIVQNDGNVVIYSADRSGVLWASGTNVPRSRGGCQVTGEQNTPATPAPSPSPSPTQAPTPLPAPTSAPGNTSQKTPSASPFSGTGLLQVPTRPGGTPPASAPLGTGSLQVPAQGGEQQVQTQAGPLWSCSDTAELSILASPDVDAGELGIGIALLDYLVEKTFEVVVSPALPPDQFCRAQEQYLLYHQA